MKQPEALYLANILQCRIPSIEGLERSAAELRRLHEVNQELLEFAEDVRRNGDTRLASMAIAVIAKAVQS